jgi:calcium-translocating P-type ATPase
VTHTLAVERALEVPSNPQRGWHARSIDEVTRDLGVELTSGLPEREVERRARIHGANTLAEGKERTLVAVFVSQLASPLIYLLFAAAVIAMLIGHRTDAAVIAIVVVLNAVIGTFQEGRAASSLRALRRQGGHMARVLRDGRESLVDARVLVPGDLLIVEAGDSVTADARIADAVRLQVAEAALTGESIPVSKSAATTTETATLAERSNMLYSATYVTAGRARAIVVATGAATEIGKIADLAERTVQTRTPLEQRIAQFGRYVIVAGVAMFLLILAVGTAHGMPLGEVLMVGISQLVGVIPEGLPVAMTIALAVGVQRMARKRAVIRQLAAVETLGSTTVICSDKTGTLTRNELTVTTIVVPDGRELAVTGSGYIPSGEIEAAGTVRELLEACAWCNDAQLDETSPGAWQHVGDPTEVALLALAIKGGVDPAEVRRRAPRVAEQPFDAATKRMATEHRGPGGSFVIIKGAPEVVVELCAGDRAPLLAAAAGLASRALRVLAIAIVDGATLDEDLRGRARLLGLVGQIDPPRAEVADAVARCRTAGIRTVMVTGDHAATGLAIARSLGIAKAGDRVIDGRELAALTEDDLTACVDQVSVFARVEPAQKLRIVGALQAKNHVVAMTGDGVNDAPALVKADVGVAMGRSGTEVAKEASKIVIGDDNFATIVGAVEEGRVVYRNIKKAILLLFSTSAAEVMVLVTAMVMGYPAPFAAVQILWNNLITEGLITVNLVLEPAEGTEMSEPPIPRDQALLDRALLSRFAFMVPAIMVSTLGWFIFRTSDGVPVAQVQTETFTLLAICEWFNVLNCRSETRSALTWQVFRNRWLIGGLIVGNLLQVAAVFWAPLASVMHTVPIELPIVFALGLVGSLVLWVEELRKLVVRRRRRAQAA